MWHRRGSLHAIQAGSMVLVRVVIPVRGVVHRQTAQPVLFSDAVVAAQPPSQARPRDRPGTGRDSAG